MASYKLLIKPSAVKEIEALPLKVRRRIVMRVRGLASNPRPAGCEKLSGHELYRVRQGHYRILYSISDSASKLIILRVGHRREVYRCSTARSLPGLGPASARCATRIAIRTAIQRNTR